MLTILLQIWTWRPMKIFSQKSTFSFLDYQNLSGTRDILLSVLRVFVYEINLSDFKRKRLKWHSYYIEIRKTTTLDKNIFYFNCLLRCISWAFENRFPQKHLRRKLITFKSGSNTRVMKSQCWLSGNEILELHLNILFLYLWFDRQRIMFWG